MSLLPSDGAVSVVMPCYDEERTIEEILRRVLDQRCVYEVVVVDDGSRDRTAELVAKAAEDEPRIRLIVQPRNLGKGAALRRGLAEVRGDLIVIQDADLEYDPSEYELVLAPLRDGRADVCYGSRFRAERSHRVLYYWHAVGNSLLTTASNIATNLNLTDMETCYKAFRREVIEDLVLEEDRFGFEPEVTAKIARGRYRVYETGISYDGRTYADGKKVGWRDGARALWCIARYNLLPLDQRPARVHHPAVDGADDELAPILTSLETAGNYADWISRLVAPYLGERTLEVGAGHGTLAARLAEFAHVTATDASPRCLDLLMETFSHHDQVDVEPFDILRDEPSSTYDSVVLANVLEHLPDDLEALRRVRALLEPGGAALVFVPAFDLLYSHHDRRLGHFRRYRRRQLAQVARAAGLNVGELRYVNPVGAIGWLATVRTLRRFPNANTVDFFDDHLVPHLERLEQRWRPPFGQSLFLAAHRPLN